MGDLSLSDAEAGVEEMLEACDLSPISSSETESESCDSTIPKLTNWWAQKFLGLIWWVHGYGHVLWYSVLLKLIGLIGPVRLSDIQRVES